MSIKSKRFVRKVGQFRRKNPAGDVTALLPFSLVKSEGNKTVYGKVDANDEDGKPQKEGRRYPGIASGLVVTEPMSEAKADRLRKLAK